MPAPRKYPEELRERAIRLVRDRIGLDILTRAQALDTVMEEVNEPEIQALTA